MIILDRIRLTVIPTPYLCEEVRWKRKKYSFYLVVQEKNYDSEIIYLNDFIFRGCQSCFYCRTHERCVLKDDLTPIYKKIETADRVLLAMPAVLWIYTRAT